MKKLSTLLCGLALVLGVAAVMPLRSHAAVTDNDKQFLQTASQSDFNEIKISQLAEQKAQNAQVKAFAHEMVTDHTALEKKMKPFADQWGLTPASSLDSEHQAIYDKLNGLSGADFDKEYMNAMLQDHQKAVAAFNQEAQETTDAKFKAAVVHGKAVVTNHLKKAEALHAKVG